MEVLNKPKQSFDQPAANTDLINTEEKFIPKGAIAFFFVLIIMALAIWYGIYFLMLERI